MAATDLAAVLSEACELFEPVAAEKGIRLNFVSQRGCLVWGNIQQLQRAVSNLIDNAVKYSPAGSLVEARATRSADAVELTVRNPGAGIAGKDLPHVFERFYRGESSRAGGGSGLGLSLAQAIVQAHGGSLVASSRPGEFTEFILRIPAMTPPCDPGPAKGTGS
jgi:signal transduction histidine kinase